MAAKKKAVAFSSVTLPPMLLQRVLGLPREAPGAVVEHGRLLEAHPRDHATHEPVHLTELAEGHHHAAAHEAEIARVERHLDREVAVLDTFELRLRDSVSTYRREKDGTRGLRVTHLRSSIDPKMRPYTFPVEPRWFADRGLVAR